MFLGLLGVSILRFYPHLLLQSSFCCTSLIFHSWSLRLPPASLCLLLSLHLCVQSFLLVTSSFILVVLVACVLYWVSSLVSLSLISSRCISHGLVYILSQSPLTHCSVVSQSCVLPCSIVPVVLVVRLLVCDHLANCFWTHLEQPAKKVPFPFPPCVLQPATQLLFFIN